MTPELQLFMVLGALVLLCIIFTLLKRGLMSVKYSLLWLLRFLQPDTRRQQEKYADQVRCPSRSQDQRGLPFRPYPG